MSVSTVANGTGLSGRERALLRAVSAGRGEFRGGCVPVLLIDGLACADFAAAHHLLDAGFLAAPDVSTPLAPAALTAAGRAALG